VAARGWQPYCVILNHDRDEMLALRGVLVGATGIVLMAILPADYAVIARGGLLLALWLFFGSLLVYAGMHRRSQPHASFIPLRFAGPMGRLLLRKRGDGRHIEIVSDGVVLAEVKATDLQDEIVLHEAVPSDELENLGSALGHAIEMVSDADEAHLDWDDHGASEDWDTDKPGSRRW
jgi:hypothetical protein